MQAINLTDSALEHLKKMRSELGGSELLLRVGVKQVRPRPRPKLPTLSKPFRAPASATLAYALTEPCMRPSSLSTPPGRLQRHVVRDGL